MRSISRKSCTAGLFVALLVASLPPPQHLLAAVPPAPFALVNCRIVTVTNGTIDRGTILIRDGRIEAVGANLAVPGDAQQVDCEGSSVYPGLIDSGTHLGLAEIGAVHETIDYSEVGDIIPQMDALTAVNPNSVLIPVTRVHGVTTVLTSPSGGRMPGTAALINLHGYTPDQMHVGGFKAAMLNFPVRPRTSTRDPRTNEQRRKAYREAMRKLDEVWDRAELYARIDSAYQADPQRERKPEYVPAIEALLPVLRGDRKLIITANHAATISDALEWAERRGLLDRVILSGVLEGWRVADQIAAKGVPAIVGPVLALPGRPSDRYDKAYANAGLLRDAGVKVAIRTGESQNVRNLPFNAGFAAAYGLGAEDALRAVTISAAEILGVDAVIGSIEAGKLANLFVANGDPFETRTQVQHLFIHGYKIPLDNRQLRLYREFLDRDPGLHIEPEQERADHPASEIGE